MTSLPAALEPLLNDAGCARVDVPMLQPAEPFLDVTGEELRRRLFITESAGETLCLRPEFTVPICRHHIETAASAPKRYAYGGTVFRQQREAGKSEFEQWGVEDLGAHEQPKADADAVLLAASLLEALGERNASLKFGDPAFLTSLAEALKIPSHWSERLFRAFGDDDLVEYALSQMESGIPLAETTFEGASSDMAEAVKAGDEGVLTAALEVMMAEHNMLGVGGRTASDIASRMMLRMKLAEPVSQEVIAVLRAFLSIDCPLVDVADVIADFEKENDISLKAALDGFEARVEAGLKRLTLPSTFSAKFGRRLDYYTGFVFEIYTSDTNLPLVGGGRYDRLLHLLGSKEEMGAVGFSIWPERLASGEANL